MRIVNDFLTSQFIVHNSKFIISSVITAKVRNKQFLFHYLSIP